MALSVIITAVVAAVSHRNVVRMSSWDRLVSNTPHSLGQLGQDLLVPTVDTLRYGGLLLGCLAAGQPALLVGPTGTGKTAIIKVKDCD